MLPSLGIHKTLSMENTIVNYYELLLLNEMNYYYYYLYIT